MGVGKMKLTIKHRWWVWLLALVMCGPVTVSGLVGCGTPDSGESTYDVPEEEEEETIDEMETVEEE